MLSGHVRNIFLSPHSNCSCHVAENSFCMCLKMFRAQEQLLPCTCACQLAWKLSMVCDPDAVPAYVPMTPDQNPANHKASGFQLPRLQRNCFPKLCGVDKRKYVSCKYVTALFDLFSSQEKVKCQMMSNNCAVGRMRLICIISSKVAKSSSCLAALDFLLLFFAGAFGLEDAFGIEESLGQLKH